MWCDSFDADLLAVVPGAAEALRDTAGISLRTYSKLTDGQINHPSAWHTHEGLSAFFWTTGRGRPDRSYLTDAPLAKCTFLEAVRDEWIHNCLITVNRSLVWRPPSDLMTRLMYDVRGVIRLSDRERAGTWGQVLASLDLAARRFRVALGS